MAAALTIEAFREALARQELTLDERDLTAALETARFLAAAVERLERAARERGADVPR